MEKPPTYLSREAQKVWHELAKEYGIEDTGGLQLLKLYCEAYDRAQGARRIIKKEGMQTTDRFGQKRPHGLLAAERDARSQMLAALKQLNLDVEPLQPIPGRPSGR